MIDLSKFQTTITKKLMADNELAISFSIPTLEDFPLNTALTINGEIYYLTRPAVIEKGGKDIWKYSLTLEADIYFLLRKRFLFLGSRKDTVYGNLEFFIDLLISNINETYPTWTKGEIDATDGKFITFEPTDCRAFLNQLATEFNVEFDIVNKVITAKEEVGQVTGYTFEYGQGKGLYRLNRKNVDSKETVTRVYGFGSSKNLPSDYGKTELSFTEGYVEDFSEFSEIIEAEYTNEDIFPSFTGAVTVVTPDWLTITVPSMDFDLEAQLNAGQEAKVVFRSGDMLGREFVIKENSYNDITKTFTLIADTDESGTTFPNASLNIAVGDTLTFIDINMPASYVTAAEAELKTATETFLEQNKSVRVVYDLVFDQRFLTKYGILPKPGDFVTIIDTDFGINRLIRLASTVQVQANTLMTSFKAAISDFIPISNSTRLTAQTIENTNRTEIVNSSNVELARQNTLKNRLLQDRLFDTDDFFDTDNIRPLSINTSFLSVGAKSQNFQLDNCSFEANYLANENRFVASAGVLHHLEVSGDGGLDWTMGALDQSALTPASFYYLYAKCSKTTTAGIWLLSTTQELADQANDYYFLVGILYEVIDGFRQTSFTYGSTFINGNTITTGNIISIDGLNYLDLDSGQLNLGNATDGMDWNVTTPDTLTIRGAVFAEEIITDKIITSTLKTGTSGQRIEIDGPTGTQKFFNSSEVEVMSLANGELVATKATIKSADTGQRIEIDSARNDMRWFNSSNGEIVRVGKSLKVGYPSGIHLTSGAIDIDDGRIDIETNGKYSHADGEYIESTTFRVLENIEFTGVALADEPNVPNDSVYKNASTGKLRFKDGSGISHDLY